MRLNISEQNCSLTEVHESNELQFTEFNFTTDHSTNAQPVLVKIAVQMPESRFDLNAFRHTF